MAYPVTSPFSRLIKSLTSSFKSTLPSHKTDIRLNSLANSMENGLVESEIQAPDAHRIKAYAMYDDTHTPPKTPTAIHYQRSYSVSEYHHPVRSSHEV